MTLGFGKIFSSLYTGSMIGAGPVVFSIMPYVIANAVPDRELGGVVELNPKLLAMIFGCEEGEVNAAIEFLCRPDPESRSAEMGGRRLVKVGSFEYQVVNFEKYRKIRDQEVRREQNRVAQAAKRARDREKEGISGKDFEDWMKNGTIPREEP